MLEYGLCQTEVKEGRPCPIGMSVVRLVGVRGSTIEVEEVDALDEMPLLDIKPYVPEFDAFPGSREFRR